ncbi:MAG: signal peptidase I [Inhella sp.]
MSNDTTHPASGPSSSLATALSALTGVLYAVLIVYLGGWFMNQWIGNFSLLLFLMSAITGVYWVAERLHFAPARARAADELLRQDQERRARLKAQGIERVDGDVEPARQAILRQPWWLDWTAGLFPVILIVFLLRSFLFEPFRIPSGSMVPTLLVGDLILVNKFHYGVRLPVLNTKVIDNKPVARGDVVVFRYPLDTRQDYIKRIVGLPGDTVEWRAQRLFINGQEVPTEALGPFYDADSMMERPLFTEKLGEVEHRMLVDRERGGYYTGSTGFPYSENCQYSIEGVRCTVPAGHYYALGDNRDNSGDSRVWGFVPDQNLVGKAVLIWMNFSDLKRIGSFR